VLKKLGVEGSMGIVGRMEIRCRNAENLEKKGHVKKMERIFQSWG
jgi:hypothetical protein